MHPRAIIFDVYGTLLEVGPPPVDADARWDKLFREWLHGTPPMDRLDFLMATSKVIARCHEASLAQGIAWPEVSWPAVVVQVLPAITHLSRKERDELLFRQMQTMHTTHLMPGAAEALRHFKAQHALLGLASNAQPYTLHELQEALAPHGLGMDLFERDLSFWSFEYGFSKPSPHVQQILSTRLASHGIAPTETLMVGECQDNDLNPAQAFGWQTWQIVPTATAPEPAAGTWQHLVAKMG